MASPPPPSNSGGFFRPTTPPASSVASSSTVGSSLPRPRSKPLKTGGSKESAFIRYVDERLRQAQRRFAKRGSETAVQGDVTGYGSFGEASRELVALVEVVWVSGTPSLQIAYLLTIADLVNTFVEGFDAPSPKALFRLLAKLDHAFASLLQGRDVETGEELPGFDGTARRVNATEKVRIWSMVQRTRHTVVGVMARYEPGGAESEDEDEESKAEESGDELELDLDVDEEFGPAEQEGAWDLHVAKVYDRTVVELGDALTNAGPPIGINLRTEN
ncbi:hypothetical protein HDK77DRAFT_512678 [Phyllosticta capitalensis]|uniref:Meiotic recombination protein dmc1 n=1 Tax=Phyllosticta capitalensis TaxID=121624 RepID=A0ABR1YFG1_9PEZI